MPAHTVEPPATLPASRMLGEALRFAPHVQRLTQPAPAAPADRPKPAASNRGEQYQIHALRTAKPPDIDGVLSDEAWRTAPVIDSFTQQEPVNGQPATERTEVRILYDASNLYIAVHAFDSDPDHLVATEMRRDANNLYNNDHFGVSFDGFYDRRNGYGFAVNALGAELDWSITNERPNNDWNGQWDVKTGTFEHGWTVEIRFPFRSFRFKEHSHVWGMNFRRRVMVWKREFAPQRQRPYDSDTAWD